MLEAPRAWRLRLPLLWQPVCSSGGDVPGARLGQLLAIARVPALPVEVAAMRLGHSQPGARVALPCLEQSSLITPLAGTAPKTVPVATVCQCPRRLRISCSCWHRLMWSWRCTTAPSETGNCCRSGCTGIPLASRLCNQSLHAPYNVMVLTIEGCWDDGWQCTATVESPTEALVVPLPM